MLGFDAEVSVVCASIVFLLWNCCAQDSLALVRLDDLFIDSFEVTDGKLNQVCCCCR